MADAPAREATTPPVVGRAGRYTVFITPPATPKPSDPPRPQCHSPIPTPTNASPLAPTSPSVAAPPVQVPPRQFDKPGVRAPSGSLFGFFREAVAKVQDAHSSLDEYLADWFGLNQSKYQWALNDYYENTGVEKGSGKPRELISKGQAVE